MSSGGDGAGTRQGKISKSRKGDRTVLEVVSKLLRAGRIAHGEGDELWRWRIGIYTCVALVRLNFHGIEREEIRVRETFRRDQIRIRRQGSLTTRKYWE